MAKINGRAKRYNGKRIDYLIIFDWVSGKCLQKIVPDHVGNWSFSFDHNMICGITYIADGCEPQAHGPYELVVSPSADIESGFINRGVQLGE